MSKFIIFKCFYLTKEETTSKRIKHNKYFISILNVHNLVNINVYVHVYVMNIYLPHK